MRRANIIIVTEGHVHGVVKNLVELEGICTTRHGVSLEFRQPFMISKYLS